MGRMGRSVPWLGLLLAGCGRIGFESLIPDAGPGAGGSTVIGGAAGQSGRSTVGGTTGTAGDTGAAGQVPAGGEGGSAEVGGAAGSTGGSGVGGDVGVAGTVGAGGDVGAAGAAGRVGAAGAAGAIGAGGSTGGPAVPHCSELPYLDQAPVLDGTIEAGMILETVAPVGWREPSTPLPAGHEMRYAAGWRPEGLYFYLEVTDPDRNTAPAGEDVWMGDSVEIYVDHDGSFDTDPPYYDDQGTRQFFVAAPSEDGVPGTRAQIRIPMGTYNPWDAGWISLPTGFGYVVEAFVTAPDLDLASWSLAAGQAVGFDLAHNVSVPPGDTGVDGNRLSQYFLKVRDPLQGESFDYPFMNESVFCAAVLAAP